MRVCHDIMSTSVSVISSYHAVSTTERHFTLSVVCLIVGRLGWKWIERSVLQLLLLKQKEVELLLTITITACIDQAKCLYA